MAPGLPEDDDPSSGLKPWPGLELSDYQKRFREAMPGFDGSTTAGVISADEAAAPPRKATKPTSQGGSASQPTKRRRVSKAASETETPSPISTETETQPSGPPVSVEPEPADWRVGYLEAQSQKRAGVPDRYDDGVQWLIAGLRRVTWGSFLGVLIGWTGAWLALWGAVFGLVAGIFVGFGLETSTSFSAHLFSLGLGQSVTFISVISGAALGAAVGFMAVIKFVFLNNPLQTAGAIVSGALITAVIVVVTACFERTSLRLRGYRRLSIDEVRQLAPLVRGVAEAMNLPALPRFAIQDVVIPNAWSHMRTIVVTKGLLQSLDDGEIRAILAHELEHWQSGDSVALHFVWAATLPAILVYKAGVWMSGGMKSLGGTQGKSARTILGIVGWFVAWPAYVLTRMVLTPVVRASQRQAEFDADAAAAHIGLASQLISALRKLSAFESARTGWEAAMSATHPPSELRIEALEPDRPDDWEFQEEELTGPTLAEVRRIFGGLRKVAKH
jgi:Zn-dependent protease with chaperone function